MSLEYTCTYHKMRIIPEVEAWMKNATGQEVEAKASDVFYFLKGAVIAFSAETTTGLKAFYCGQGA